MSTEDQQQHQELQEKPQQAVQPTAAAVEDAHNVSTEPIEGSGADNASKDTTRVAIGPTIYSGLSFSALAVFVIGTPINWFLCETPSVRTEHTLWASWQTTPGQEGVAVQWGCSEQERRWRAMEAFAIISIGLSFFMFLVGVLARAGKSSLKAGLVVAVLTFITSLIAWGMGVGNYYASLCEITPGVFAVSFSVQPSCRPAVGLALFIVGWLLTFLAAIVAAVEPTIPEVIPVATVDKACAWLFSVASFVSGVFVVIGTQQPWFHRWMNSTTMFDASLWKITVYVNGVFSQTYSYGDLTCGRISDYSRFGEAFAIISIALMVFAFIAGLLAIGGFVGKRTLFITGISAFLSALITVGAGLVMYYRRFCSNFVSFNGQAASLSAGFALFVAAAVIMIVVTLVLAFVAISQVLTNEQGNKKWSAFLLLASSIASLLMLVIAADQNVIRAQVDNQDSFIRVSWWRIYQYANGVYTETEFGCDSLSQRLVGGGALVIISIFWTLLATIFAIAQLINNKFRIPAAVITLLSSVTQLVAWALAATVFNTTFCDVDFSGFKIAVGIPLVIVSWGLSLVVGGINLIVS